MPRYSFSAGRTAPALLILVFAPLSDGAADERSAELPPPPGAESVAQEIQYRLELVINRRPSGQVVPVTEYQGRYRVSAADLRRAGLPAAVLTEPQTDVTQLAGVNVEYDSAGQRLLLQVPSEWLPPQLLNGDPDRVRFASLSGRGTLLNYDVYASRTGCGATQLSAWNEVRFFSDAGTLSNTGVLRRNIDGDDTGQDKTYTRYDTTLSDVNENHILKWAVGDVISNALSWSSSVRLGGISVSRDFSVRPDVITYPLPAFSGNAAVPTSADLFINGYKASSTELQPGPFTLTNTPYINGAGEAVLVTTDALGRQVSTSLPFYVANTLLKPGLSDASFSTGALRRSYGTEDFDYGPAAANAVWRYGVNDAWTLESHAEGAEELALLGVGSSVRIGNLGVVNGSYSDSRMYGKHGAQYGFGYQYSNARFSLSAQRIQRDARFGNLALYDNGEDSGDGQPQATLSRSSTQYAASLSLARYGNIGLAYLDVRSFDNNKTRLFNLSWSKNLWHNSSFYLSASRDPDQQDWTFALTFQVPFNALDSVTFNYENNASGQRLQEVSYSRAMPSDGGFSWDLAYARQHPQDDYQQGSLTWRNEHIQLQGGLYGSSGNQTQWGEATGSLVMMEGALLTANKVNDAFVIVSTEGYPDVEVNYEHQPIGKTNGSGYLLIPGVTSYYPAHYGINVLNMPADVVADKTEQQAAVRRGSGYVLHFPIKQQRAVSVILADETGHPVPLSSTVSRRGHADVYVGWDGLVYLEDVAQHNPLRVRMPDGRVCQTTLTLPATLPQQLKTYGPLVCRPSSRSGVASDD
ncbi:fimbria/pilus outer membrane usher protein [Enterobacillus tribolii]|uniref:Outer membrane usher protein n=1 Tax=Enterobacillus tribolii TaxID=1487935 RepID=A0A370R420_9GAMM|nr:fimbria/pilus outer membrane usher protein [Enterobacillus tribolii]MBW7984429.1 fimbrial biogenesis outer membrane usher protein [Enterobacillus tribolii]RDK97167.1 outer membrane usher protein [Enterobacillus tribolii]